MGRKQTEFRNKVEGGFHDSLFCSPAQEEVWKRARTGNAWLVHLRLEVAGEETQRR